MPFAYELENRGLALDQGTMWSFLPALRAATTATALSEAWKPKVASKLPDRRAGV